VAFDYLDERFQITDGNHGILADVLHFLWNGGVGSNCEDRLEGREVAVEHLLEGGLAAQPLRQCARCHGALRCIAAAIHACDESRPSPM